MNATFSRFFSLGTAVGSTAEELHDAARDYLDWYGSSELDRDPLEYCTIHETDDDGNYTGRCIVAPCFGSKSTAIAEDVDPDSVHDSEAAAIAREKELNAAALEAVKNSATWYESPVPLRSIDFSGCERGKYPQSRFATLYATTADGREFSAIGFGNAPLLNEPHSPEAVHAAAQKLIAMLAE